MFVHMQRTVDGRRCALVAITSFAQTAIDADGGVIGLVFGRHTACVNQLVGMLDFAAHGDGKLIVGYAKA